MFVNNFLNNAEQKIILFKMLEIVYAEKKWTIFRRKQWIVLLNAKNKFYECSKHIRIYNKYDIHRANFINVETDFINAEK